MTDEELINDDLTTENADDQEFFEHHRFNVDPGQGQLRVDKYIVNNSRNLSRNKIQMAAKADCILVNEKPVKSNYRVKPNDVITIVLPHPPHVLKLLPENIPINIIYEDDDIIIVDKEAGMVVHPGLGNYTWTVWRLSPQCLCWECSEFSAGSWEMPSGQNI